MRKLDCLIDLHIHLDGAISVDNAKKLAKLQGIEIPKDDEILRRMMMVEPDCKDLTQFLEKFDFPCSLLMTEEGLEEGTYNLCRELQEQGVMYAEIRFAPQLLLDKGMTQEDAAEAAIRGFKRSGLPGGLILCCMRGSDNRDANIKTVEVVKKYLGKGVVLLDLAGAEALYPTSDFDYIFDYADKLQVPYTIHAGEADGPKGVKSALSHKPVRIGHGVRAIEDENILQMMIDKNMPFDLCPTSNIQTCIFKDISEYPLRKLMEKGAIVTINTDDPAIEGTTLYEEFEKLDKAFNLTDEEIKGILFNSVNSSCANDDLKEKMFEKINSNFR